MRKPPTRFAKNVPNGICFRVALNMRPKPHLIQAQPAAPTPIATSLTNKLDSQIYTSPKDTY